MNIVNTISSNLLSLLQ